MKKWTVRTLALHLKQSLNKWVCGIVVVEIDLDPLESTYIATLVSGLYTKFPIVIPPNFTKLGSSY